MKKIEKCRTLLNAICIALLILAFAVLYVGYDTMDVKNDVQNIFSEENSNIIVNENNYPEDTHYTMFTGPMHLAIFAENYSEETQPEEESYKANDSLAITFYNKYTEKDDSLKFSGIADKTVLTYEELLAYENPFADVSSTYYRDKLEEIYGEHYVAVYNAFIKYAAEGYEFIRLDWEAYDIDTTDDILGIYECAAGDVPLLDSSYNYMANTTEGIFSLVHGTEKFVQIEAAYEYLKAEAKQFEGLEGIDLAYAVNEYLGNRLTYDLDYVHSLEKKDSYMHHACFEDKAICDGYASYFLALVQAVSDEECISVISMGTDEREGHEYIAMTIDGSDNFYIFDPTSNDNSDTTFIFADSIEIMEDTGYINFPEIMVPLLPEFDEEYCSE